MLRPLCWLSLLPLLLVNCRKAEVHPALQIEAYVWQDPDRPEVAAAMRQAIGTVTTFHVRAAELRWNGKSFTVDRPVTDKLPAPGCGLVIRIGSSASRLEWTPGQIEAVAAVVRSLAALGPSEIQCDYDCPQKSLDRYLVLLDALQKASGGIPIAPTVLPSWMGEPEFGKLVSGRAGYVLQVHSLGLPKSPNEPVTLCDFNAARIAVKRASSFTIPFRVAMATYGCEVWFGPDGKVMEVISEDAAPQDKTPARKSFALADPGGTSDLVREWMTHRPAGLRGVIWYRLPIEGDRRNWPWITLRQVAKGEKALTKISFEPVEHDGTLDLFVVNGGGFPGPLPAEIIVPTPVMATDGLGAYRLERREDGLHFIRRAEVWPWLDPGKKIPTGWLRTSVKGARMEWHIPP